MKNFFTEFKAFIARGNAIDLAVGIIIGSAFTAIVTSLVDDIIMPIISRILGGISFYSWQLQLGSDYDAPIINFGTFFAAIVNFVLIALVVFVLIKLINAFHKKDAAPTTKKCPYCLSDIDIQASRCPHCTSQQPGQNA